MNKLLKTVHVLGVTIFVGSIFGHIVVNATQGASSAPQTVLFARQAIRTATQLLTIPGLWLTIATGSLMFLQRRTQLASRRWLLAKLPIVTAIALITMLIMAPVGANLLAIAAGATEHRDTLEHLRQVTKREDLFGTINMMLILATLFLSVAKPRLLEAASRASLGSEGSA